MINLQRYVTIHENQVIPIVPTISINDISIIIPAKNDQPRLDNLLCSLSNIFYDDCLPLEVIVVDNNSNPPLQIDRSYWHSEVPLQLVVYKKRGAVNARNYGSSIAKGIWLLFCDHDCIATISTLKGYLKADNGSIAYAGFIKALNNDLLSKYYESQDVLHAPDAHYETREIGPMYVVTANALILKTAFEYVNGFKEEFIYAAEDVELSLRLWQIGKISHAKESVILHDFTNSWIDFCKRFFYYGIGNGQLEWFYPVKKFPKFISVKNPTLFNRLAASIHWICLVAGYFRGKFLKF